MKIKQIVSQYRRDIIVILECEHCEDVTPEESGYDDAYYHNTVIPSKICTQCGEKSPSNFRPLTTKYSEHEAI